jgi:cyanophycinase
MGLKQKTVRNSGPYEGRNVMRVSLSLGLSLLGLAMAATPPGSSGPPKGALVVGGGDDVAEIRAKFRELAGGTEARVVLIPTASELDDFPPEALEGWKRRFGFKNVTLLHTRDPKRADAEDFVAPLREADAVWFGGGRQWRLVDAYLGTRTQREIEAVLARGGVVGGSSAGATIQGSYLVRGAPEGNHVMMAEGHEVGFGYLRNVAVDQHLITRHREEDLLPVIKAHPELLGIGLDEPAAIVVRGDVFEVIGRSKVAVYDRRDHGGRRYFFLEVGDRYDLKARSPIPRR